MDDFIAKVKSVPPIAWVIGIGVILVILFASRGGSSSGATADNPGGTDNSGGDEPNIDQEVANLFGLIRADQEQRAVWQKAIDALLKKAATPSLPGTTPTPSPIPTGTKTGSLSGFFGGSGTTATAPSGSTSAGSYLGSKTGSGLTSPTPTYTLQPKTGSMTGF